MPRGVRDRRTRTQTMEEFISEFEKEHRIDLLYLFRRLQNIFPNIPATYEQFVGWIACFSDSNPGR